jgi:hypothetical protein
LEDEELAIIKKGRDVKVRKIKDDEVALLKFGLKWLKSVLFQVEESEKLPQRDGAADKRKTTEKDA